MKVEVTVTKFNSFSFFDEWLLNSLRWAGLSLSFSVWTADKFRWRSFVLLLERLHCHLLAECWLLMSMPMKCLLITVGKQSSMGSSQVSYHISLHLNPRLNWMSFCFAVFLPKALISATRAAFTEVFYTPPFWISVIDWRLQLIGWIWCITTSLEFHIRLNAMIIFWVIQ